MKKLAIGIMTACLSLTFIPMPLKAAIGTEPVSNTAKPAELAQIKVLINRLDEINTMDKSTLNSSEKRQLRKEVRSIKSQLNSLGGGVYLSAGAIIIIILLLIILF